jgi:hypothetical protein
MISKPGKQPCKNTTKTFCERKPFNVIMEFDPLRQTTLEARTKQVNFIGIKDQITLALHNQLAPGFPHKT